MLVFFLNHQIFPFSELPWNVSFERGGCVNWPSFRLVRRLSPRRPCAMQWFICWLPSQSNQETASLHFLYYWFFVFPNVSARCILGRHPASDFVRSYDVIGDLYRLPRLTRSNFNNADRTEPDLYFSDTLLIRWPLTDRICKVRLPQRRAQLQLIKRQHGARLNTSNLQQLQKLYSNTLRSYDDALKYIFFKKAGRAVNL